MEVKLFGDFILDSQPTNFDAAVKLYQTIPTYLGTKENNYEGSVPMEIQLTPIDAYCDSAAMALAGISEGLLNEALKVSLDLNKILLKLRTLGSSFLANKFLDISTVLSFSVTRKSSNFAIFMLRCF